MISDKSRNEKYLLLMLSILFIISPIYSTSNNKVIQVNVKNQFDEDEGGGGSLSCAYHAIKNGLVIVKSLENNNFEPDDIKDTLVNSDMVNVFFGPVGEWCKIIASHLNKKAAIDYIYNYLLYSFPGYKEIIYNRTESKNPNDTYSLKFDIGHVEFKCIDNSFDKQKHRTLISLIPEVSKFLIERSYKPEDLAECLINKSVNYKINKDDILNCFIEILNQKNDTQYQSIEPEEIKKYLLKAENIKIIVNNSYPSTYKGNYPQEITNFYFSQTAQFTNNLHSEEIEYLTKSIGINNYICIAGESGSSIAKEFQENFNPKLTELVNNIKNKQDFKKIIIVHEDAHWYTCVVDVSQGKISYYLANSNNNIPVYDCKSFIQLREVLEDRIPKKSYSQQIVT